MKKNVTILVLFVFSLSFGQNLTSPSLQRIKFSYDSAGNQTQRIISLCAAKNAVYKDEKTLTDTDLLEEDKVLYYPNPVLEQLYIKWKNTEAVQVTSIELYSMNGQQLQLITDVKEDELTKINFTEYPTGYYIVVLVYSDGTKKELKIIKK